MDRALKLYRLARAEGFPRLISLRWAWGGGALKRVRPDGSCAAWIERMPRKARHHGRRR